VAAHPGPTNNQPNILATMTKNSVANLFRVGSSWIVVLFLPPLLVRVLDKPTYGVWLLLLQLASYITFFDGGIQIAIARYVARSDGMQARRYLAGLLSSAGMIMIVACLVTILLTALASWHLTWLFPGIPASIAPSARRALMIIGTSLALTLPFTVLAGFFLGRQRNEVAAFAASFGKFTGALGSAWAAYHHRGMLAMAMWVGLGYLVQSLTYLVFWRKEEGEGLLHPSRVEPAVVREFIIFCSAMLVSQFSSFLITGLDMPIVAAFDFRSVAYYGVASILANVLIVPHSAIVSSLLPVAAGISAGEDPQRLGQLLQKTTRFATAVLCLITLPLLLLMPLFLRIWVGPDYASHALLMGEILVAAQFVRLTMFPYAMIGFAAGQQQRMLISPVFEGTTNLLFSLILVQFMGSRGVALGTLIGAFVGVCLHLTVSLSKTDCVHVDRAALITGSILKPIALTLPFMLCALLAPSVTPPLHLLLVACAELALFVLLWSFSFESAERKQFKDLVGHFASIFRRFMLRWANGSSLHQP
jgi:O-antigen/teichoic acid export membrane protein